MLPLRFPKLWSALGWLLIITVVVGSLAPSEAVPSVSIGDKILHTAAYFVLMVWFGGLYRRGLYPLIAAVLLGLGAALDLLQMLTETRSFEWADVAMNSLGVGAGWALSRLLVGGWCQYVERRLLS